MARIMEDKGFYYEWLLPKMYSYALHKNWAIPEHTPFMKAVVQDLVLLCFPINIMHYTCLLFLQQSSCVESGLGGRVAIDLWNTWKAQYVPNEEPEINR